MILLEKQRKKEKTIYIHSHSFQIIATTEFKREKAQIKRHFQYSTRPIAVGYLGIHSLVLFFKYIFVIYSTRMHFKRRKRFYCDSYSIVKIEMNNVQ